MLFVFTGSGLTRIFKWLLVQQNTDSWDDGTDDCCGPKFLTCSISPGKKSSAVMEGTSVVCGYEASAFVAPAE